MLASLGVLNVSATRQMHSNSSNASNSWGRCGGHSPSLSEAGVGHHLPGLGNLEGTSLSQGLIACKRNKHTNKLAAERWLHVHVKQKIFASNQMQHNCLPMSSQLYASTKVKHQHQLDVCGRLGMLLLLDCCCDVGAAWAKTSPKQRHTREEFDVYRWSFRNNQPGFRPSVSRLD